MARPKKEKSFIENSISETPDQIPGDQPGSDPGAFDLDKTPEANKIREKSTYTKNKELKELSDNVDILLTGLNTLLKGKYALHVAEINIIKQPITNIIQKYLGDYALRFKDETILIGFAVSYVLTRVIFGNDIEKEIKKNAKSENIISIDENKTTIQAKN
jgi:hypothetical protein